MKTNKPLDSIKRRSVRYLESGLFSVPTIEVKTREGSYEDKRELLMNMAHVLSRYLSSDSEENYECLENALSPTFSFVHVTPDANGDQRLSAARAHYTFSEDRGTLYIKRERRCRDDFQRFRDFAKFLRNGSQ